MRTQNTHTSMENGSVRDSGIGGLGRLVLAMFVATVNKKCMNDSKSCIPRAFFTTFLQLFATVEVVPDLEKVVPNYLIRYFLEQVMAL